MKRTVCLVMAVLLLAVSLCACGGKSIVGSWKTEIEGLKVSMVFEDNGTCKLETMGETVASMEYKIEDGKLIFVTMGQEGTPLEYKISGKTLTIYAKDEPIKLTRE